jgi:hypothetical protein
MRFIVDGPASISSSSLGLLLMSKGQIGVSAKSRWFQILDVRILIPLRRNSSRSLLTSFIRVNFDRSPGVGEHT